MYAGERMFNIVVWTVIAVVALILFVAANLIIRWLV